MSEPKSPPIRAWPLLRRFWPWLRPHRRYAVAMLGLLALATPLGLASPLIVREVIDGAIAAGDDTDLLFWGGILIGLTCVSVLMSWGVAYAQTLFHTKVLRDVRMRLHRHMQRLSLRYYADRETGFLMSRQVDDVGNLHGVMADHIGKAIIAGVGGIGYTIMLFWLEWRMAAGGLLFVVLIFGFEWAISGALRRRGKAAREKWTQVSEHLHQSLSGHSLVQGTASETREARRFAKTLHGSVRADLRRSMLGILSSQALHLIGGLGPSLIVLCGVYLITQDEFTIGGLFAFFMFLMKMFGAVHEVAGMNPALQNSLASLERIFEVVDAEPEVIERPDSPRYSAEHLVGDVRFEAVSFAYDDSRPVVHDITLHVPANSMIALVGPSGGGKTTIARLVLRLFDPTEGHVLIDGADLRDYELASLRRSIGLVPQEIFLFDRSIADNIAFGKRHATREEIEHAAQLAQAYDFVNALEHGFDTKIGERGVRLSGGQRQRIAIAREFLRNPRILILDEATSSLDSESEARIQSALDGLLEDRTSFVIAHRLSTVTRADAIVVIDAGRVVERGTHAELLEQRGLYRRLYDSQFKDAAG